ncbi:hypothetical protein LEP1GSC005_2091 [Leptospira santarosai str. ST188]|nr:hypothetical protein LEP1GSC005_2091 [Leptospira santarosai str. ST188]
MQLQSIPKTLRQKTCHRTKVPYSNSEFENEAGRIVSNQFPIQYPDDELKRIQSISDHVPH